MTLMHPTIYTTETIAVRGLAALIDADPQEASAALFNSGVAITGTIDPDTVRPEQRRTDLPCRTDTGEEIYIEAKVDDYVDPIQLGRQLERYPGAHHVLLVADMNAPDVKQIDPLLLKRFTVLEWEGFLIQFSGRHAQRLRADVGAITNNPCSKRSQRYALRFALGAVSVRDDAWQPRAEPTLGRLPSIILDSPCGNVRAQLEVTARQGRLSYTAGIGFTVREGKPKAANAALSKLLRQVIAPLDESESHGCINLSRNASDGHSRVKLLKFEDKPYYTRGYADYVGVKLKTSTDPCLALSQLYSAFEVFETVALRLNE
jgi:hypothetical protein